MPVQVVVYQRHVIEGEMKRTKVVNLIGAPSSGKSLCAGLIFAELKIKNYTTEYVQEYVKHLVWKGDLETVKNQYYVSSQQYKLLKNINGKVDYIVTDGSLIHGLYYNKTYKDNVSNIEKTEEKIIEYLSEFDNIFIFLERNEKFRYETEGRIHSFEESIKIESDLKKLLDSLNLEYLCIKSDKENVKNMINYIINSKFCS